MAIQLPLTPAAVVDPYGGLEDLAAGVLRTPDRREQSFDDDPLRMLRAARFAAQLEFDVERRRGRPSSTWPAGSRSSAPSGSGTS